MVAVELDQPALVEGVRRLRDLVSSGAWGSDPPAFTAIDTDAETGDDEEGMDHGSPGDAADDEHAGMDHGGMDHGTMDHGDGGFMSMVAMTKDLPRGPDGLPMETVETPFGPLFPGLPAGLAVTFTLDGDVVTEVEVTPGTVHRDVEETWPGPVAGFAGRLARIDPLAPVAYRLLAERALLAIDSPAIPERTASGYVAMLERERIASHLGWLAEFTSLLGVRFLADRAATLHLAMSRDPETAIGRAAPRIRALLRDAARTPLLQRRLAGIADLHDAEPDSLSGPVARATGLAVDARTSDPIYGALGFHPIVIAGSDAWARLQVRLAEIEQSLDLCQRQAAPAEGVASSPPLPRTGSGGRGVGAETALPPGLNGSGAAEVETPRGAVRLEVETVDGRVTAVRLDDRPRDHAALIPTVARGAEVADALAGVASLDLSPWAIDR